MIGIDVVSTKEVESMCFKRWFVLYAYTYEEFLKSETFSRSRKIEYLSSRFCAKEAVFKCLCSYTGEKLKFKPKSIEVLNNANNVPVVKLDFPYDISFTGGLTVSISHKKNICVAIALIK